MKHIELTFHNESVMGYGDPCVVLYVDGVQYDKVWAYIDKEQGRMVAGTR